MSQEEISEIEVIATILQDNNIPKYFFTGISSARLQNISETGFDIYIPNSDHDFKYYTKNALWDESPITQNKEVFIVFYNEYNSLGEGFNAQLGGFLKPFEKQYMCVWHNEKDRIFFRNILEEMNER